jgi:hypothetical protein
MALITNAGVQVPRGIEDRIRQAGYFLSQVKE